MEHYAPSPLAGFSTSGIGYPAQHKRHRLYEQRYLTGEPAFRQLLGRKHTRNTDHHQLGKYVGRIFYHDRAADTHHVSHTAAHIDRRRRVYQCPERRLCSRVGAGPGNTRTDIDDPISYRRQRTCVIGRIFFPQQEPQ